MNVPMQRLVPHVVSVAAVCSAMVLVMSSPSAIAGEHVEADSRAAPAATPGASSEPAASALPGNASTCDPIADLTLDLFGLLESFGIDPWVIDIPEPGWVLVDRNQRYQQATGRVVGDDGITPGDTDVSYTDFPAVHDSHDQDTKLYLDPGQEGLLSDVNAPNDSSDVGSPADLLEPKTLGVEWETGTFPGETGGGAPERTFPSWAWPSPGDRVWVDGSWIFDCGHPKRVGDVNHYRSEIHPPRAIASMRDQMALLPGSGATPVRSTEVDLYVHGRSGLVGDVLDCGAEMTFDAGTCGPSEYPRRGSPIDVDFGFDVCLPAKPAPSATLSVRVEDGPGNTLSPELRYQVVPASATCTTDAPGSPVMLHVSAPLAGTGATPDDVYARRLTAGWLQPDAALTHVQTRLSRMVLHDDTEERFGFLSGGDCECSFFFLDNNRAQAGWHRLAGYDIPTNDDAGFGCSDHFNRLTDFDDDKECGNGNLLFSGPTYDFYVGNGMDTVVTANGWDQDCQDHNFGRTPLLGHVEGVPYPTLAAFALANCYLTSITEWGNNDAFPEARASLSSADLAAGFQLNAGMYDMYFDSATVPLTSEDTADLGAAKTCEFDGEVALVGQPVTCTITVTNSGPGLPRDVVVTDSLTEPVAGATESTTPSFTVTGPMQTSDPVSCESTSSGFSCAVGSVPVGGRATITWTVTPHAPGTVVDQAVVTTASNDPVPSNNTAQASIDAYQPVTVEVRPGEAPNHISLTGGGVVAVAVLSTPTFDARTIDPSTVCFGSADEPATRDCTEKHGKGHLSDVDHDGDIDLVLHYEANETGIQPGDTQACLIGRTFAGTGIYGCDAIGTAPVPSARQR